MGWQMLEEKKQEMKKIRKYKQIENTKEAMEPYGGFVVSSYSETKIDPEIMDSIAKNLSMEVGRTHEIFMVEQLLEFIESYSDLPEKDVLGAVKTFLKEMKESRLEKNK